MCHPLYYSLSADPTPYENKQLSARAIQRLCPSVDLRNSRNHRNGNDVYDDVLLIVTFNRAEYHNIPLFEVIYRDVLLKDGP